MNMGHASGIEHLSTDKQISTSPSSINPDSIKNGNGNKPNDGDTIDEDASKLNEMMHNVLADQYDETIDKGSFLELNSNNTEQAIDGKKKDNLIHDDLTPSSEEIDGDSEDNKDNNKDDSDDNKDDNKGNDDDNEDDSDNNEDDSDDNGDSSDDDSDDDEDDDDEDEPPLLKYSRVNKLPPNFFNRDSISTCLFHEKVFFFGTHSGILHITRPDFSPIHTLKCHRSSILSIFTDGENFATGSMDGTIIVGTLDDPSQLTAFDFKRPIHAVVLDSDFKTTRTFISGGKAGEVILSQRNWLGNRTDVILSKGNGPILGIFKIDNIVLWMDECGITFSDTVTKTELLNIPFPEQSSEIRPDLFRPHVHFPESDRIIVGWYDNIWLFKVSLTANSKESQNNHFGSILSSAASSLRASPDKAVELEKHFNTNMILAGIASFKDDELVCLGFDKVSDEVKIKGCIPELNIVELATGKEKYNDEVVTKNYERSSINDYHLGKFISDTSGPIYYLISSTDCISAETLSLKDYYIWYIERKKYQRAWEIAGYAVSDQERLETGLKYLDGLIEEENWIELSENIDNIISTNLVRRNQGDLEFVNFWVKQWQRIIIKAIDVDQISTFVDKIPKDIPRLDKSIYDAVLNYYLDKKKMNQFGDLIRSWDSSIYSISNFERELEQRISLHDNQEKLYQQQLIFLYIEEHRYSKAVPHMIDLKDETVIDIFLKEEHLLNQFTNRIVDILLIPYKESIHQINTKSLFSIKRILRKPIELIISEIDFITMDQLFEDLRYKGSGVNLEIILLALMQEVSSNNSVNLHRFENEIIRLYSEYDKSELLQYLKDHSHYNVDDAIELCSTKPGLYNELIYLWGRIGEAKKALSIIIDELNDPSLAIEFVKSWGDVELWDFMISYTVGKSNFTKELLKSQLELGDEYVHVIESMDNDQEIEGLSDIIASALNENSLSYKVKRNIYEIIDDDTKKHATEYLKLQRMGRLFDLE